MEYIKVIPKYQRGLSRSDEDGNVIALGAAAVNPDDILVALVRKECVSNTVSINSVNFSHTTDG